MASKTNCVKNGTAYYRVTTTVGESANGKPIRKEFYGKNKKAAEDKRDEYLNGVKNGLVIDFEKLTLIESFHTWFFTVKRLGVRATSFQKYEGLYRNHIKNGPTDSININGLKLNNIKSIQLQRYYNSLYNNGRSSNIIKNVNKLLNSFFIYAVEQGYLLKNPCSGIVIPGQKQLQTKEDIEEFEDEEVVVFTDEEINILKSKTKGSRLHALILIDLATGLRQGELLALTWKDIDFVNNQVKVTKSVKRVKVIYEDDTYEYKFLVQTPKNKRSRIVPIPSSLIPVLNEHDRKQKLEKIKAGPNYEDKNLVFPTINGTLTNAKNLFKSYKALLKKIKIPHKKFHGLRHTYATKLFERGVPLKTISMLLGHSSIEITANIYTHVMPKEKISAAEMLNDLFA